MDQGKNNILLILISFLNKVLNEWMNEWMKSKIQYCDLIE